MKFSSQRMAFIEREMERDRNLPLIDVAHQRKRDLWRWPKGSIHRQLAALSQQAHEAAAAVDTARVREIEVEIDQLATELWGLTEGDLREIRESLEELS